MTSTATTSPSNVQSGLLQQLMPWMLIIAVLLIMPMVFKSTAMFSTLNYLGTMAIFALSYNILLGQTGLLSLGHGTFFGLGGFMATHAVLHLIDAGISIPLPLIPLIGGLGAFLLGIIGGWLASARGGMVFAMITLGLAELVYAAAALFPSIYGSEEGVSMDRMDLGSSFGMDYAQQSDIYAVVAVWFVISAVAMKYLTRTPLGLLCNAVRDNSERIEFLGFSPSRVRLSAYALAAMFAGVAGSLAALNFEIITTTELGAGTSTLVLLMTYIGGTRVFFGPVLGAIVIGLMKIWLSDITPAWMMYFGLLFIFVVMIAPGGLAGMVVSAWQVMRSGNIGPQLAVLGQIAGAVAAVFVGGIFSVELGYRSGIQAAMGADISVLGVPLNTHSIWSWLLAAVLLLAGSFFLKHLLGRLSDIRHALGKNEEGGA